MLVDFTNLTKRQFRRTVRNMVVDGMRTFDNPSMKRILSSALRHHTPLSKVDQVSARDKPSLLLTEQVA